MMTSRQQVVTVFASVLELLVDSCPGAVGAVFADEEGEAVDFFGPGDPDDIKLIAAHMGVLISSLYRCAAIARTGKLLELRIKAKDGQFVTRSIGHGYQVTVILKSTASLPKLEAAFDRALVAIRVEAGGVLD